MRGRSLYALGVSRTAVRASCAGWSQGVEGMGTNYGEDRLIETLERQGEDWVRQKLLEGTWTPNTVDHGRVTVWLGAKDAARRDAREAESLSISRRALRSSTWANIIAIIAMILSAIVAIVVALKP
jgi:hypothetical protein